MSVTRKFLLGQLPKFVNDRVLVADDQEVRRDIIPLMLRAHQENEWLYDRIGKFFIGADIADTCDNLYRFCVDNLRYVEEKDKLQTVSVPQGLLTAGQCDCKGYASFICGCLGAVERYTGNVIPWHYCFASYEPTKRTPYHVFAVVETNDRPIWVDPTPGADGKKPIWWINKKVSGMALEQIIGKVSSPAEKRVGLFSLQTFPQLYPDQQSLATDLLLASDAPTVINSGATTAPAIVTTIAPAPVPEVYTTDNVATVPPPGDQIAFGMTGNQLLLAGGAVGLAVYLLLTKKKKSVGKKKGSALPLLIGAGIVGYYLYSKSKEPVTADTYSTAVPDTTATPTVQSGTTPYIMPTTETIQVARSYAAEADQGALERTFPEYNSIYAMMTDAEIIAMYNYMFGYVIQGLKLYAGPGATGVYPDGNWNTILYNQISAIKAKYNISI